MAVTDEKQRAGPVHGQVDRDTFDDFVEVHVAAEAAGITRWHRAAGRRSSNTPEHGTKRHSAALQVIATALTGSDHPLSLEMPASIVSSILERHCHVAVDGAVNDSVIADGVVSIQANAREVYRQRVTGPSGFDVERTGFRIAADRSPDAPFYIEPAW